MNFQTKERGSVVMLVVFVALLGALAFFLVPSFKGSIDKLIENMVGAPPGGGVKPSTESSPKALSKAPAKTSSTQLSSQIANYPGAYKTQTNSDLTTDVYYQGEVGTVTDSPNNTLIISLKITRGDSAGTTAAINLSKIPATNGAKILGNNFKEMVDKGIKAVNIRIRYSQSNQFIEWELI